MFNPATPNDRTHVYTHTKTYTYNKRNQLLTETKTENGETTEILTYEYNAKGQRTAKYKTINGSTNAVCFYSWNAYGMLTYADNGGTFADAASWVTTENALRKEHGYGRRVKY